MTNHIAVGEIATQELILGRRHSLQHLLCNFLRLHSRCLLKGNYIGRNLLISFQFFANLAGTVTVPEIGNMAVFLGLGHRILGNTGGAENLRKGIFNHRGLNQVVFGDVQVSVILQHTSKLNTCVIATVKLIKILAVKCQGNFLGAVAAEVKQHNAVAIFDFRNRLAISCYHKGGQILIDAAGLGAIGFNSLRCGSKLTANTLHVGTPALFYHCPVSFVTVHGYLHTATAGSDCIIAAIFTECCQQIFQLLYILECRSGRNITTIQQNVAVSLFYAFCLCLLQKRHQVSNIGMDITIGQQTNKMHCLAILCICYQVFPGVGCKQYAIFNRLAYQLSALRINLTTAEGIVSNL